MEHGRAVVIPAYGCINGGGGAQGGGDIYTQLSEHRHPVYHEFSITGAISSGVTTASIKGVTTVVLAGQYRLFPRVVENGRVCNGGGEGGRCIYGGGRGEGGGGARGKMREIIESDTVK